MNDQQLLRYSRHILLNEISIEGQQKWLDACILVVGCGGLGAAVLPYLAASGIGKLIIADDDVIDETNLPRQICYTEADIGCLKTKTMKRYLQQLNSGCLIETHHTRLDAQTLAHLMPLCDVVVDCSDNFTTRQAINAAAVQTKKPLVSGSAIRFDGQLAVYRADLSNSPCYHCLFNHEAAHDSNCATFGVFAPLVGMIGASQAAETLKILAGLPSETGVLRCYNALSNQWQSFRFSKQHNCTVCGQQS